MLCVDDKSQNQALDRTQPGLPLKKGRGATMTHDYKRNGTATLFAALNSLDGTVIGMCQEGHRHQDSLKFLRVIDDLTPADKELHLIADNYATHKHAKVQTPPLLAAYSRGTEAQREPEPVGDRLRAVVQAMQREQALLRPPRPGEVAPDDKLLSYRTD